MIRHQLLNVEMVLFGVLLSAGMVYFGVLFGVYLESRYKIIEKSIDKLKRRMK